MSWCAQASPWMRRSEATFSTRWARTVNAGQSTQGPRTESARSRSQRQRPGLAALPDYARQGDAIVVVGIDRLGRNAAEVMTTIRDLGERGIVLRSLREGTDTSNASGRMVASVLASLAELELELGKERRTAARDARRARGQSIGRPKAPDQSKMALAQRMHASGESASTIAAALGVNRAAGQFITAGHSVGMSSSGRSRQCASYLWHHRLW
jgi:DNA invertase Pin-like site-specific DNA recombinase